MNEANEAVTGEGNAPRSEYEDARILSKRAFYERATQTIRSCPENYCLAYKNESGWHCYDDHAAKHWWATISKVISDYAKWSTGDALATEIGKTLLKA